MTNCIDIGNLCVGCGRDTEYGTGLFVNRINAEVMWNVNDEFSIYADGFMCYECQEIDN
mgnify:CR=1 FL=1